MRRGAVAALKKKNEKQEEATMKRRRQRFGKNDERVNVCNKFLCYTCSFENFLVMYYMYGDMGIDGIGVCEENPYMTPNVIHLHTWLLQFQSLDILKKFQEESIKPANAYN